MLSNRYSLKLGGESGQGINTLGILLSQAIKNEGFNIFAYREYPSLIKGGVASYQIDFSDHKIEASSQYCDILAILDKDSLHEYLNTLNSNGVLLYNIKDLVFSQEEEDWIKKNDINKIFLDTASITQEAGGSLIMSNIVMIGYIWNLLGFKLSEIEGFLSNVFATKGDDIVKQNIKCLYAGYEAFQEKQKVLNIKADNNISKDKIITGNEALALGAIAAGVRAYYAYPMTPSTSIFKYIGDTYKETGILIKQAESEITAVQMAMGSMAMGTRALVATSGGGFDLMQETISCTGITETPLVIVLAQRTGAGTGLPTWTGSGDIHTAVKSGHGEFPKIVIQVSDIESAFIRIQEALNLSEQYQVPVIVLTEKQIAEGVYTVPTLPKSIPVERYTSYGDNRYKMTENGISPRWIPSFDKTPYIQNSDEHDEKGGSTEDASIAQKMMEKRYKKMIDIKNTIPEPVIYGSLKASTVLVGSGSTKNAVLDAINQRDDIAYLHYEYIYPMKTQILEQLVSKNKNLILVENNQTGELGRIIKETCGYEFKSKILKYNGRPFFVEDILNIFE